MAGDALWNNVVLLVDWEGTPSGTDATDASQSVHPLTFVNCTLSDAQSRFGVTSVDIGGASTHNIVTVPNSPDWDFGSGDFTVELWYRAGSSHVGTRSIINWYDPGVNERSWRLYKGGVSGLGVMYSEDGATFTDTGTTSFGIWTQVWRHLCMMRSGDTLYVFVNGSLLFTEDMTGVTLYSANTPLAIGGYPTGSRSATGYVDDVRITKGIARYSTTGFSPPTEPFPVGPDESPTEGQITAAWSDQLWDETGVETDVTAAWSEAAFEEVCNQDITCAFSEVLWNPKRVRRMQGQIRHGINASENGSLEEIVSPPITL